MKKRKNILRFACLFLILMVSLGVFGVTDVSAGKLPSLKVSGTKLVNSKGRQVQLKGVSTHGIAWFPEYINQDAFTYMKKNWGINTVRLALYTSEYNGYCNSGAENRKVQLARLDNGISCATKAGLYVIVDWHILSDGNPKKYEKQAVSFWRRMAKKYKNHSNVIYEICNEPNGGTSWKTVKSYATKVIKEIRRYDKNAVILVGTPNWSQNVDEAAKDPLDKKYRKNVMYSLHFYAGTHGSWLRDKASYSLERKLPLFVSEFAICDASGSGKNNVKEGEKWMDFLNDNKISYIGWNLSNKSETSALIRSSCRKTTGWKTKELSYWGRWLIKKMRAG